MSPKTVMVLRGLAWYLIENFEGRWPQKVWLGLVSRTNLGQCIWWTRPDLNREPTDYESAALTIELRVLESHRSTRSLIHQACESEPKAQSNKRSPRHDSRHGAPEAFSSIRTSPVNPQQPRRRPRPSQRP